MGRSRTHPVTQTTVRTEQVHRPLEAALGAAGSDSLAQPLEALVESMAGGNEAALSEIYDRFSSALYSIALRIVGSEADAAEVTLDAFTQAWKDAGSFERGRSTVATWLCMLVRSRAIDLLRRRQSRQRTLDRAQQASAADAPAIGATPVDASHAAEVLEKRRHIDEALSGLAREQRQAIELAYFEGLTQSQIAERLGVPLGTIKTRIRTGMRKLRDVLGPLYADELA